MGEVTRFPSGMTNAANGTVLGNMGQLDPTKFITWFDDFHAYTAGDWTITTVEAGAGSATEATSNVLGGVLVLTNDAADNDADFLQWKSEPFLPTAGKRLFFKARFKVSDATQSDFVMGLQITDTTPLDVTDGIFFQKDDGDALLDFHVEKDNTATSATAIATVVADTYLTVGFEYDGVGKVYYYVNDAVLGALATTNLPDDEALTISFGIQNGEAVAKVMSVDYIFAAQER